MRPGVRILRLTPTATVRLWPTDDLAPFTALGVERRTVRAGATPLTTDRVILEALVPRGARAEYGLLAFRHERSIGELAELVIPYGNGFGAPMPQSLAAQVDEVRIGLPREHVDGVLAGAGHSPPPPGVLTLTGAAHGTVGSSPSFFSRLARAALFVMCQGEHDDDTAARELRELLV